MGLGGEESEFNRDAEVEHLTRLVSDFPVSSCLYGLASCCVSCSSVSTSSATPALLKWDSDPSRIDFYSQRIQSGFPGTQRKK